MDDCNSTENVPCSNKHKRIRISKGGEDLSNTANPMTVNDEVKHSDQFSAAEVPERFNTHKYGSVTGILEELISLEKQLLQPRFLTSPTLSSGYLKSRENQNNSVRSTATVEPIFIIDSDDEDPDQRSLPILRTLLPKSDEENYIKDIAMAQTSEGIIQRKEVNRQAAEFQFTKIAGVCAMVQEEDQRIEEEDDCLVDMVTQTSESSVLRSMANSRAVEIKKVQTSKSTVQRNEVNGQAAESKGVCAIVQDECQRIEKEDHLDDIVTQTSDSSVLRSKVNGQAVDIKMVRSRGCRASYASQDLSRSASQPSTLLPMPPPSVLLPHEDAGFPSVQLSAQSSKQASPVPEQRKLLSEVRDMMSVGVRGVVKEIFMGHWPSNVLVRDYGEFPPWAKRRFWELFQTFYYWDSALDSDMRRAFHSRCASWFRDRLRGCRQQRKERREAYVPPHWIPLAAWQHLCQWWDSPEFESISKQNSKNKKMNGESCKTPWRGGSRSAVDILRELRLENPNYTVYEFYERCYRCRDQSWSGPQAAENAEKIQRLADTLPGGMRSIDEMLWAETVGSNKNRVFGLGSLARVGGPRSWRSRESDSNGSHYSQTQTQTDTISELVKVVSSIAMFLHQQFPDLSEQLRRYPPGQFGDNKVG